ncbi:hypothetical protein [Rhodovulum kholense]|uniref:Uncharacterized protein n=1 Tax=Rhodovulum kholense TaxID=453584 RepID=A0A8E2VGP9_9RHOB|nr:hypothetical protein [Rhodovulum kholense]PTW44135.1 hypothetical protein C8N38_11829 [Rhodovulum kholense]
MTEARTPAVNIVVVGQAGRLTYEAVLFAASLRAADPDFSGRLFVAEPQPGPLWPDDPGIADPAARDLLPDLGAEILPFESRVFGAAYPYGNKIEALLALPQDEPFLFFDSDTLVMGALSALKIDFARPSASMRREGTWPVPTLYGPGPDAIWRALYARFGLDFDSSLDPGRPVDHWRRYLYFNAGWFFAGCPRRFGQRFLDYATAIRDDPPPELVCQPLDPWLDQVALPLTIHAEGGGRPGPELDGLDGDITCHWRRLPLFYARESDRAIAAMEAAAAPNRIKRVLKAHPPMRRFLYRGKGAEARALFDRADLPRKEQAIRNQLKRKKLWTD